ncbi:MAG: copper transporter [Desulfotomaculales bacterium]
MIIDLRYHIVSLVAVFLALGIGILVGSTVLGGDTLVKQQEELAGRLEQHLEGLRRENDALRAELNRAEVERQRYNDFAHQVLPLLVADRLKGMRIAVIETAPYDTTEDLKPVLEMAGGTVSTSVRIVSGLKWDSETGHRLKELTGWDNLGEGEMRRRLSVAVAQAVVAGPNQITEFLEREGLIEANGGWGTPVNSVVLLGGSYDRDALPVREVDLELISFFAARGIPVYGVEESGVTYSCIKDYRRRCTATVDNVDTPAGQFALVMALAGWHGNFGVKDTADRLLPPVKEAGAKPS